MKNSVIIVMFCIASGLIAAQETIDFSQMDSPRIFSEQYYQFIKSRDYSGRGYKWTGRWLWNSQFRQGQAQNAAEYLRAARTLDSYRSKRDIPLSQSGWSPVGPRTLGRSYDTASGHGIGRINCVAFHPSDPNTLWIGSPHGGIWKSTTGGQSWIPQGDELPVTAISDICVDPNDPDIIYISTGDYGVVSHLSQFSLFGNGFGMGVFKSTNGGDSWAPTGLSFELSDYQTSLTRRVFVHPDNSDGLIAAGTSGVFVSSDAGETWQNTFKNMIWDIEKNPANPDVLYAYSFNEPFRPSADRRLIKSTDFGATWDTLNIDLPADSVWRCELAISPIDNDLIYLVASNNRNGFFGLYCSTDAGESWERRSSHEEINILDWYAGTLRGGQASYDLTIICDREDKDRIYVGGVNLWGSTDGGRTWDIISHWADFFGESLHADQHFSAFNPLDGKYYFCNDGGITRTSAVHIGRKDSSVARIDPETERPCEGTPEYRFPTVWEDISEGLAITEFYRIGLCRDHEGYVTGGSQDNSCFYNNKSEWINYVTNYDGMVTMIDHLDPEIIYGVWQMGGLCRSMDGGRTIETRLADTIDHREDEEASWVTPFTMHPADPEVLYAGFTNVWRSDNRGNDWQRLSDFAKFEDDYAFQPITQVAVAGSNPDYIYISKLCSFFRDTPGSVWRSSDGGEEWKDISGDLPVAFNHPGTVCVNPSDFDNVFVGFSGFDAINRVFASNDGGDSWENITYNLPALPVNSLVFDHSGYGILYAAMDIGIYYLATGSTEWQPYSENLPNCLISDLCIHAKSGMIYAATHGRGIWMVNLIDPTDVNDQSTTEYLAVSPNPSHGELSITSGGLPMGRGILEIVDIAGRAVWQSDIRIDSELFSLRLNPGFIPGVYFVRIIGADGRLRTAKFSIIK